MTPYKIIQLLLDHLPDSIHDENEDPTWTWAWEELSDDAQKAVKVARRAAQKFVSEHQFGGIK